MAVADTSNVRGELADELAELMPHADVLPYGVQLDEVTRPLLLVVLDRVARPVELPVGTRRHELTVWLVAPTTEPGAADDELDGLLDGLLQLVDEQLPEHSWSAAERDTYASGNPAYRVTITRED